MLKKKQFSMFSLSLEKLRSHDRATFKNSNPLCELGKLWKYRLRSTLKSPNFESTDELRKVTVENKMVKLHKIESIFQAQ